VLLIPELENTKLRRSRVDFELTRPFATRAVRSRLCPGIQEHKHGSDRQSDECSQHQRQQEEAHVPAPLSVRTGKEQSFQEISSLSHILKLRTDQSAGLGILEQDIIDDRRAC
jgi:hypothetical protein